MVYCVTKQKMKRHIAFLFLGISLLLTVRLWGQEDDRPAPKRLTEGKAFSEKTAIPEKFTPFKKKKKFDLDKLLVEPAVGFGVSQNYFNINLRPYVGYNVWKGLYVGGGITFMYARFNKYFEIPTTTGVRYENYVDQVVGGGIFLQYRIWKGLFARTTFEFLNRKFPTSGPVQSGNGSYSIPYKRVNIPVLLIGGGYNFSVARFISMPLAVYYNVLNNNRNTAYSIYPRSVIIQLGLVTVM